MPLVNLFRDTTRVSVLCIENPPVNVLSGPVARAIDQLLTEFSRSDAVALVVCGSGRTFSAGGDILEFERPDFSPLPLNSVLTRLESSPRIVVAAMHGSVLGGGWELALACHYRIAHPATRFAFPEVRLGLIPGSLGTQRMPRAVGVNKTLDLMLTGKSICANEALRIGALDAIRDGEPRTFGVAYAHELLARSSRPRRLSERDVAPPRNVTLNRQRRSIPGPSSESPAVECIVRSVTATAQVGFAEGEALEAELFAQCRDSPQSKALRHLFFAERAAGRRPELARTSPRRVARIGIVGTGSSAGDMTIAFARAGFEVVVVSTPFPSERALNDSAPALGNAAASKPRSGKARSSTLSAPLDFSALWSCDLVVEAASDSFAQKEHVCRAIGAASRPGAIIASNCPGIDIMSLACASSRPSDFIGIAFGQALVTGTLLEIVHRSDTAQDVVATAVLLGKALARTTVLSSSAFLGSRLLEPLTREAERLLLEGANPSQIDVALEAHGLELGPCRMLDLAGLTLKANGVDARHRLQGGSGDPTYRVVLQRLSDLGRTGRASGAGIYRYKGKRPVDDPAVAKMCRDLALEHGIAQRSDFTTLEIVERCLYPVINEGAHLLEKGIAYRPGDIDVVCVRGYGFVDFRGGPMWMADELGLSKIVRFIDRHAELRGNASGYWSVGRVLRECASSNRRLREWTA